MPGRVIKVDWTIRHIGIPIPTLRVGQVGDDRVRLQKVVDIRRTPELHCHKNKTRRENDALRHAVHCDGQMLIQGKIGYSSVQNY